MRQMESNFNNVPGRERNEAVLFVDKLNELTSRKSLIYEYFIIIYNLENL